MMTSGQFGVALRTLKLAVTVVRLFTRFFWLPMQAMDTTQMNFHNVPTTEGLVTSTLFTEKLFTLQQINHLHKNISIFIGAISMYVTTIKHMYLSITVV